CSWPRRLARSQILCTVAARARVTHVADTATTPAPAHWMQGQPQSLCVRQHAQPFWLRRKRSSHPYASAAPVTPARQRGVTPLQYVSVREPERSATRGRRTADTVE